MRIWDYRLLPYLPDAQFKGQLRELVLIMRQWRDKGKTNHLLINRVMEHKKIELVSYFIEYCVVYSKRYGGRQGFIISAMYETEFQEFLEFGCYDPEKEIFDGWHNKEYLRSNMANLWEKHTMGVGKSRITDEEWQNLLDGYKQITGEDYVI